MPRRSDARPRAIRATSELLQRQGYAATGLEEILSTSGAPKGSFYFHFPGGKTQLAAEAVAWGGRAVHHVLEQIAGEASGPGHLVRRFARLEADQLASSGFELGCPVATVTLEMASRSDDIREASDEAFSTWAAVLAERLEDADVPADEALELADWTIATLEGGLILARARRDAGIITKLAERVARVLDDAVEARSGG